MSIVMPSQMKVLVTGATGQVVAVATEALAKEHEVWCVARFTSPERREWLEAHGIKTVRWDMGVDTFDDLPDDFGYVLHAAADRGADGNYTRALGANCEGTGMLMTHCRNAKAFLFVSSFAVYSRLANDHAHKETDPQQGVTPFLPVYGPTKVATEGVVRAYCRTLGLPTIIARLNSAHGPYGWGGLPVLYYQTMLAGEPILVPRQSENVMAPIHSDDISRQVPLLWDAASVPATIVNWAGDESVTEREIIRYIAKITGVQANIEESDAPLRQTRTSDNTRRERLIGKCHTPWREGVARTIEAHFPGAVKHERE